jgi:hypothetical protein
LASAAAKMPARIGHGLRKVRREHKREELSRVSHLGDANCGERYEECIHRCVTVMGSPGPPGIEVPYRDVRWRRTSRYSCQINPITTTSKTVNTMRPKPCVYEKR